jgi:hypothetical protein
MSRDFFDSWSRSIVCFRLALTVVALLIMVFFGIVSKEGRALAVIVVVVLPVVLYRDVRTMRSWRQTGKSG